MKKLDRSVRRASRHHGIREKIKGTQDRPRLSVYRSNQHIYAQLINDKTGTTLIFACDLMLPDQKDAKRTELAFAVGKDLAQKALKKEITEVVFDRGGFLYHGRIAKLAEGAREGGLKF